jgi:hypothetical protein
VALQPNGAAGVVADGFGGLHSYAVAGGVPLATRNTPYWLGWPLIRGVAI